MSGWSADNEDAAAAASGWAATPPRTPPGAPIEDAPVWDDRPTSPPAAPIEDAPVADAAAPPPAPGFGSAAWATPEAPNEPAWATPEAGPAGAAGGPPLGVPGAPGPAGGDGWVDTPEPLAPPRLPVPLQTMTATDVVDGAWAIIKTRAATVFAITAMILLPVELLSAVLTAGGSSFTELFVGSLEPTLQNRNTGLLGAAGVWVAVLLQNLVWFFLGGAIARLVSSWYGGGDMTARQAVAASFRKAPAMLGAFAMLLPLKVGVGAVTCGLALPFVIPLFMVTAPAIVIEDRGPWAGPRRSFDLVRRRYWACIGVWFLALVIELTVNLALSLVPAIVASFVPASLATVVTAAGTVFAAFVTAPFVVGVSVLLYLDLRIRTEGLDLELDAADVFARAA